MTRAPLLAVGLLLGALGTGARADVTLVGVGTLPGDASDLSGLKGKARDGTPLDRLGGLGSAIAWTGKGDEYVLASDRGPKDGAADFVCRVHRMTVRVAPGAKEPVRLALTATTLLTDEAGKHFVGAHDAFEHKKPEKNLRLDPEGLRVGRDGGLFVADEFGPVICEFDAKGRRVRALPVPAHFQCPKPGKHAADELPPKVLTGRQPGRGMEGLAISADGGTLFGLMQGPLIQDAALNDAGERVGRNCRLLELDLGAGKACEFVYPLDDPAYSACELLAVGGREFLALERDARGGKDAAFKRVFRVDLAGATDVSAVPALPAGALPESIKPAKKLPFLDLLEKRHGIGGPGCPEKFEGLAFGPDLPDGRRLLLITADNDFVADKPFRVYAFAVDRADLPTFQPQQFGPRK